MIHSMQVVAEAIRGRDAAWLVELMHDYDQITGVEFENKYPEFIRCEEVAPFTGSQSTLMTLLKMAAGIHYAQAIDARRAGTTKIGPVADESAVLEENAPRED